MVLGDEALSGERVERRLTVILAADVAEYSRLMGQDEAATLSRLHAHRRDLIDPKIAEHKGRIVKTTGDGVLVEFLSVVEAVACAVEFQRGMVERNIEIPKDQRIEFRVGINLGDVIVEDGDIFGDCVNIAARLEALAKPGGMCLSAVVREQVGDRLDLSFADLGEQTFKNIKQPVRTWELSPAAIATTPLVPLTKPISSLPTLEKRISRIEFQQNLAIPIEKIGLILCFDKDVAVNKLDDCALRINIFVDLRHWSKDHNNESARMLWIGTRTRFDPSRQNFIAFDNFLWTTTFDGKDVASINCTHPEWGEQKTIRGYIELYNYHVRDKLPFTCLNDLARRNITAQVTKAFLGKLSEIGIVVNGYVVCKIGVNPDTPTTEEEFLRFVERTGRPHVGALQSQNADGLGECWPEAQKPGNWVTLCGDGPWRGPQINFDEYQPERVEELFVQC